MKKLLFVAAVALAAACSKKTPPQIASFTADKTTIDAGGSAVLSFVVNGATAITITPGPGTVTASPVTVTPTQTTTYTLRATNDAGAASQDLTVTVNARASAAFIVSFTATPAQVPAGGTVTLSWNVQHATRITISDGSAAPATDVTNVTSRPVTLSGTTTYTLTATSAAGATPATATATAIARVASPANVATFSATPGTISQGQSTTLSWTGTATSWSLSDGTTTTNLGPARSLTVRPSVTTTYTITGNGAGGTATKTATVTVTPNAGVSLSYTPPTVGSEKLKLIADAPSCGTPTACTVVMHVVAATAVSLRGAAFDLPLDSSKVTLDPTTLGVGASFITDATPAAAAVLGTGPLKDTLVFGAARKGAAGAAATDASLSTGNELAHFTLKLVPAGGKGVVFDGSTLSGNTAFQQSAVVRGAGGDTTSSIAVGQLVVQ